MGVRECGRNLGVDNSGHIYTYKTENQMWGQRDKSEAVGISAVGDKDFAVGVPVLEHASGNWENVRSSQEKKEIGIKTNINLNTHKSFSLYLTENDCVSIINTIPLRSLRLCTSSWQTLECVGVLE